MNKSSIQTIVERMEMENQRDWEAIQNEYFLWQSKNVSVDWESEENRKIEEVRQKCILFLNSKINANQF